MKAIQTRDWDAIVRQLSADPEAMDLQDRLDLANEFEQAVRGRFRGLPSRLFGTVALLLVNDEWPEVRKSVGNVLHLLPEEDYEAVLAQLKDDPNGLVQATAERARVRHDRHHHHQNQIQKVMGAVAKLAPELQEAQPDKQHEESVPQVAVAFGEPVTLDEFMRRYCHRGQSDLASKRRMILKAIYHGTIQGPKPARPYHRGRSALFNVHDLMRSWPEWESHGLPLPPLITSSTGKS